jgi:hypothetical protein
MYAHRLDVNMLSEEGVMAFEEVDVDVATQLIFRLDNVSSQDRPRRNLNARSMN